MTGRRRRRWRGGAAAAYGTETEMRGWAEEAGCGNCEIIRDSRTDTLVFAAQGEDFAVVCFRGTADLRNWITDLDARRVQLIVDSGQWTVGAEVHEGFQTALGAVWGRLLDVLTGMAAGKRNVFFTGHSLGGALAMLCAARWMGGTANLAVVPGNLPGSGTGFGESPKPTGGSPVLPWVYTFGQPRVGNGAWKKWYDARLGDHTFRIIHADDVVARVPWLLRAYRHCGTEVFYPARAKGAACLIDAPWWRKAGSEVAGFCQEWRQGRIALLADHHVGTYVGLFGGARAPGEKTNRTCRPYTTYRAARALAEENQNPS